MEQNPYGKNLPTSLFACFNLALQCLPGGWGLVCKQEVLSFLTIILRFSHLWSIFAMDLTIHYDIYWKFLGIHIFTWQYLIVCRWMIHPSETHKNLSWWRCGHPEWCVNIEHYLWLHRCFIVLYYHKLLVNSKFIYQLCSTNLTDFLLVMLFDKLNGPHNSDLLTFLLVEIIHSLIFCL